MRGAGAAANGGAGRWLVPWQQPMAGWGGEGLRPRDFWPSRGFRGGGCGGRLNPPKGWDYAAPTPSRGETAI